MVVADPVRILEAVPEFGYRLPPADREAATAYVVARTELYDAGEWQPATDPSDHQGHIGLLVLEGLAIRSVKLGHVACAEVLGHCDVLRPWNEDCGFTVAELEVGWRLLKPTRLAVLDDRFASVACRWPGIIDAIMDRTVYRARCLAFHLAVTHLSRIDIRVLVTLWFLAERFGRVTGAGVVVPLRLTHQVLAQLVGAQRPSVSTAIGELADAGLVTRRRDHSWLLHGAPPADLRRVRTGSTAASPDQAAASA